MKKKPEYRTRTVEIEVMVCAKCKADMKEETNPDAMTMWHWKCTKCGHKY